MRRSTFCTGTFFAAVGLALGFLAGPLPGADAAVFVSPRGDDGGPGTAERPFATLERARDAARAARAGARGPVRIVLGGGAYYLRSALVLGPEDSGTGEAPAVIEAAPGERPVVSGGRRLDLAWRPYRDGIFVAEVPAGAAGAAFDELRIDGVLQRMARYPNFDPRARNYGGTAADCLAPARWARYAHPAGAFVHALHVHEWGDFHYRVTGLDEKGAPKLEGGWQNNRRYGIHPSIRFVENVFEELDAPGEWYFDREKSLLYVWPPAGVDLSKARVEAAGLESLVEVRGTRERPVRSVRLRGLTFTATARTFLEPYEPLLRSDWTIHRGGAVFIEGAEDCAVEDCGFDGVGGNAVFVSRYARRVAVTGCRIVEAGASGVCFVGDPGAVRSACFDVGQAVPLDRMDREPGPKTPDYPAGCRVADTYIRGIGRVEKQTAGVQISMAEEITVSRVTIHDVPRAGINIGDGTWGGHVIEHCDVFDTVKETGDHGSFNSWGRDRFWHPDSGLMRSMAAKDPAMPFWDARKTTEIRGNRWRCDHGWDIDLDDGSSNYRIHGNLCLHGGLKLREGFGRTVEGNILAGCTFHPHVWFEDSGDVFRRNIVGTAYAPIGMPKVWGQEVDGNLFVREGDLKGSRAAGRDLRSAAGDPLFVDPAAGDYRVRDGSPALRLGFENFPMEFGVRRPDLKAEADEAWRRHEESRGAKRPERKAARAEDRRELLGATVKNLAGLGELSVAGLGAEAGVLVVAAPAGSPAARAGLRERDVILEAGGKRIAAVADLAAALAGARPGRPIALGMWRDQTRRSIAFFPADGEPARPAARPTPEQAAWQDLEVTAFAHFGANTFTDREWGEGKEDPKIFDPAALDARQWTAALTAAGVKLLIITAKHHDGFCLWPSARTGHSVKGSPWRGGKGDVVREVAGACREAGLKLGIYLSPWDRHEPSYGDSPRYNAHFVAQLRELLTGYGDIAEMWFDGACGEGLNGKKQEYDWPAFYAAVRECQPHALIAICGPDVRWVGNESGLARDDETSVQPAGEGKARWYPAECDVSIRPGWFYHAAEDGKVKSAGELMEIYCRSVGRNSNLLLNIPPDRRGLIHENDARRLAEFGAEVARRFGRPVARTSGSADVIELAIPGPGRIDAAVLQEDTAAGGERVRAYAVEGLAGGAWKELSKGTVIGHKRIDRFPAVAVERLRLRVLRADDEPLIRMFAACAP